MLAGLGRRLARSFPGAGLLPAEAWGGRLSPDSDGPADHQAHRLARHDRAQRRLWRHRRRDDHDVRPASRRARPGERFSDRTTRASTPPSPPPAFPSPPGPLRRRRRQGRAHPAPAGVGGRQTRSLAGERYSPRSKPSASAGGST